MTSVGGPCRTCWSSPEERRKRITGDGIAAFVEMLQRLPIQIDRRREAL
jgi:hypothetical protein